VPELTIPNEYERGIEVVKSLPESDVDLISKALEDLTPSNEPSAITRLVRPSLANFSESDVDEFAKTLHSLYLFRSHSDVAIDDFVTDLCEAIQDSENPKVRTSDVNELAALKRKFKSLLDVRALSLVAKAHGLRSDFANIFWDAKMISDIRPVWNGDVKASPEGVVITHTLKLEYHYAGGHGEIYVAMDNRDIDKLMYVLERAQDKAVTLKALATTGWLKILDE
jgi:hypothetical protein